MFMAEERKSFTYPEAAAHIAAWVKQKGMTMTDFQAWLEVRGVLITRQYCGMIVNGGEAGPKFRETFQRIVNMDVEQGLILLPRPSRRAKP